MTLQTYFSLTPLIPQVFTYNAANPGDPNVSATMDIYGGLSFYNSPNSLKHQYSNDELILGYDPVAPADQTIGNIITAFFKHNTIHIHFRGYNVSTEHQYLLLFSLRRLHGTPIVQFFIGTKLVRSEGLSGDEQVAILMDAPGSGIGTHVFLRLASSDYYSMFGFKGMDCYLL